MNHAENDPPSGIQEPASGERVPAPRRGRPGASPGAAQRQLLLGIFFIIALSILAFYTLFLTDIHIFTKPIVMDVYFPVANGLREGDPVYVLGTRIGRVTKCQPDTTAEERRRVHVVLSLDSKVELTEGAQISIRETSLLGGRHVDINPGRFGGPPFPPDSDGAYYGSIFKNPIDSFGDLGALLNENRVAINNFLTNLDVLTTDIKEGKGLVGKLIEDPALAGDVKDVVSSARTFMANARDASEQLKSGQGLVGALLYDQELKQKFDNTVGRIEKLVADLESKDGLLYTLVNDSALRDKVTSGIDSFVAFGEKLNGGQGTLGMLLTDPTTKQQVSTIVSNLTTVSADMKDVIAQVKSGEGTFGKLLVSDEMYQELKRTLGILNRSLEDYREAAPITAFTSVLFAAF